MSLLQSKGLLTKDNKIIFFFILPTFLCFGYMTGSDWRMYETDFNNYIKTGIYGRDYSTEILYKWLIKCFQFIGFNFWWFTIVTKIFGYYVFFRMYKYFEFKKYYGLILWLPYFALFMWIDHPARNFLAIAIYSIALKYVFERKLGKYCLLSLLAFGMHSSSLALIPFYFYFVYRGNKNYWIDLCLIVVTFFVAIKIRDLMGLLPNVEMVMRLQEYGKQEEYQGQVSFVMLGLFWGIVAIAVSKIKEMRLLSKYADFIVKCGLVFCFLFAFANINTILFRLPYFMMLPYTILVSLVFDISNKFKILKKIQFLLICFFFYYNIHLVTKDFMYVPYSSYLEYVFQEKPSFHERANYNFKKSPYNKSY